MSDRPLVCGTRAAYQRRRCRCTPCRAAEAAYRRQLRQQHARGKPPLGAYVPAGEAWALLYRLQTEWFTRTRVAHELGLRDRHLQWHPERIRFRTVLRLRRLYRVIMLEDRGAHA